MPITSARRVTGEPLSEYVRARPAQPLRHLIGWYSGYRDAGVPPAVHRGLPSPYLTLIFTLDDPLVIAAHPDPRTPPGSYDAIVGGLHTAPALVTHNGRQSGIQVALSPLGARALLGLPAGEVAGADVPAGDVLGAFAEEVRGQLLAVSGWAGRFAALDRLLLRRLSPARDRLPAELVRAWALLRATDGAVPVAALAREVGWSGRYLARRFAVDIGLSPKLAARVVRFDRARRQLQRHGPGRDVGLADLAAGCGYFDQAHLAREFAQFAGCPPSRWLAEEGALVAPDDGAFADEFRNVQAPPRGIRSESAA